VLPRLAVIGKEEWAQELPEVCQLCQIAVFLVVFRPAGLSE